MTERWAEIIKCMTPEELDCFLYDAYNLGMFHQKGPFYPSDEESKREFLEGVAEMMATFIINHAEKIKYIYKKI